MKEWLTNDDVEKLFPEILEIKNKDIQDKCKEAFVIAYKEGNWSKDIVDKLPVSIKNVKTKELNKQIDHIRAVTKIAINIYDTLDETYPKDLKIRDYVIAGALLHDVGKMLEFSYDGDRVVYSPTADIMRHPLSGAILAAKVGLPDELIHIIATHSFEGKDSYHSLASIIVNLADEAAFKYITFQ